jgi:hypothetical protein
MTTTIPADLQTYLLAVRDRQANLDLSIFQEGQERDFASVSLDTFYVPLRLAGRPPEEDRPGLAQAEGREKVPDQTDLRSNQLLAPENRLGRHLVLVGDAGSGKTTILRHLTGALSGAWLNQAPDLARSKTGLPAKNTAGLLIPLFIPLRHYHHFCQTASPRRSLAPGSFVDFLPHYFRHEYDLRLGVKFYRSLLASGRCLLALDGFDEVPDETARAQVISVVSTLATNNHTGRNSIVLSSRVAAYGGTTQLGGSFQTLWVQNLNREERAAQVRKWVAGIAPYADRRLDADDILGHMPQDSPLDQLVVTPLIVTALCVVYFYDYQLPEQRAQLYRRCIDIMLYERLRRDEPGEVLVTLAGKPDFKRQLLARLAFAMHAAGKEAVNKEQAARWLKDGFKNIAEEERLTAAYQFLDAMTGRGTLLQERGGLFGFGRQHLTFREFLAGYHLILGLRSRERQPLWPDLVTDDRWREPVRLAVGAAVLDATLTCEDFLTELLDLAEAAEARPAIRLAGYKLAAEALWDLGQSGRALLEQDLQRQIIAGLAERLADPAIADPQANLLLERATAAQTLGRLGDPREGVTTLPPPLTAPIEGQFLYSQEKVAREVTPFQACVYPITNAQFARFVAAGGYEKPAWWSEAGLAWLKDPPDYRQRPVRMPEYWSDATFNNPNQPVVGVSYYEAEAFCAWLTATYEREYRLPTEEEWERLARGQHGREYPWGNEWEAGLANTSESGIGRSGAVGLFPGGVSPTGAFDCAGNVWEWCASWYDKDEDTRVLRGGSWGSGQDYARCAARYYPPDYGDYYVGFRLVSPI